MSIFSLHRSPSAGAAPATAKSDPVAVLKGLEARPEIRAKIAELAAAETRKQHPVIAVSDGKHDITGWQGWSEDKFPADTIDHQLFLTSRGFRVFVQEWHDGTGTMGVPSGWAKLMKPTAKNLEFLAGKDLGKLAAGIGSQKTEMLGTVFQSTLGKALTSVGHVIKEVVESAAFPAWQFVSVATKQNFAEDADTFEKTVRVGVATIATGAAIVAATGTGTLPLAAAGYGVVNLMAAAAAKGED